MPCCSSNSFALAITSSLNVTIAKDEDPINTLSNFFSYCGTITNLYTEPDENGTMRSFITFEDPDSVKNALFLTGGTLNGQVIHIEASPLKEVPVQTQGIINNQPRYLPPVIHSMTSIIASLLAAGYTLRDDVIAKAKEFDEQHGIVERLKETKNMVQTKFVEIDGNIKDRMNDIKNQVQNKIGEVGQKIEEIDTRKKQITEQIEGQIQERIQTIQTTVTTNVEHVQQNVEQVQQNVQERIQTIKTNVGQVQQNVQQNVEQYLDSHENIKKGVDQAKQWGQYLWEKTGEVSGQIREVISPQQTTVVVVEETTETTTTETTPQQTQ